MVAHTATKGILFLWQVNRKQLSLGNMGRKPEGL